MIYNTYYFAVCMIFRDLGALTVDLDSELKKLKSKKKSLLEVCFTIVRRFRDFKMNSFSTESF